MGEVLEIVWPQHNSYLCEELWRLFNSGDGRDGPSDLEISCHDAEPFAAHFIILRVFCRNLVDINSRQIVFTDTEIKKDDLQCLLEFMYLGKTCVNKKRLQVIRRAAEQLGLVVFVSAIDDVLENRVAEVDEEDGLKANEINASNSEGKTCERTEVDEILEISPQVAEENLFPNKKLKKSEGISTDSRESGENNSKTSTDEIQSSSNAQDSYFESSSKKSDGKLIDEGVFDKDVSCPFCYKMFRDKYRYAQHLKIHTKPGSFKCPHCSYRGKLLEKHMSEAHQLDKDGNPLKKLFACNICSFKCLDQVQLMGHAQQKHGTREFKCGYCTYVCYANWRLERHLKHMHFVTLESAKVTLAASKVTPRISVVAPGISVVNSAISKVSSGVSDLTPKISVVAPGISVVSSKNVKFTPEILEESSEIAVETSDDSSKILKSTPEVAQETPEVAQATLEVAHATPEMIEEKLEERSTDLEAEVLKDGAEIIEEDSVVVEQVFQVIEMDSGVVEVSSEVIEVSVESLEESSRPFKCDICGEGYKTAAYLKSHAEVHLEKVVCEICGVSLAFKSLQKHKKMVHREDTASKTFQCHLCSVTFSAKEYLKNHVKKVHTERRFKCETCGDLFKTPWGLTSHAEVHLERINCNICDKSLTRRSHRSHMNLIHGIDRKDNSPSKTKPTQAFKCAVCPFTSRFQSLLQRHVRDIHPVSRNYACQVCGMRFKNKKGLDCHSSVHQERVVCTFCGKSLSQRCVPSHVKIVHMGKKPPRPMTAKIAKCPLNDCDFKSNYRSNLKKHLKKRHRLGEEELEAQWDKVMDEITIKGTVKDDDSSIACATISFGN